MLVTLALFDIKNERHDNVLSYNPYHSQILYRAKYKLSNVYKFVSKVERAIENVHVLFEHPSYVEFPLFYRVQERGELVTEQF